MDPDQFNPSEWTHELFDSQPRQYAFDERDDATVADWQAPFREALSETLGHGVIADRGVPALDAVKRDETEMDGYVEEDWTILTESGVRLPFYLLLPDDGTDGPYPTVLATHGHTGRARELTVGHWETEDQRGGIVEQERDFARQAVRRGYAAIAPTMRGFGELTWPETTEHACAIMQHHAQLFGRSMVGDRSWDVSRTVDFAEADDRLDAGRLAITGHSGGATIALFSAAVDERIDVCVPNCYFCALQDSICSRSHCECNYAQGVLRLGELWDVAGLIAPRPFRAITGAEDDLFPLDGAERAFENLVPIYAAADGPDGDSAGEGAEAAGAADRCDLRVGEGGHRYYADLAWPFIEAHL